MTDNEKLGKFVGLRGLLLLEPNYLHYIENQIKSFILRALLYALYWKIDDIDHLITVDTWKNLLIGKLIMFADLWIRLLK